MNETALKERLKTIAKEKETSNYKPELLQVV